jgi:hypothetical protein
MLDNVRYDKIPANKRFRGLGRNITSAIQPIGLIPRTSPFRVPLGRPRPTAGGYLIAVLIRSWRKTAFLEQPVAALVGVGSVEHENPGPALQDRGLCVRLDVRVLGGAE